MVDVKSVQEYGNQMLVILSDGTRALCYPTSGGVWLRSGGGGTAPDPGGGGGSGDFSWPFSPSVITSGYGPRTGGVGTFHEGADFSGGAAVRGAAVKAARAGTVTGVNVNSGFGTYVIVFHGTIDGKDIYTNYGHLITGSPVVSVGQSVSKGQKLAELGDTGTAYGNVLHWETHKVNVGGSIVWNTVDNGNPRTAVDPVAFMATYGDGSVV